MFFDLITGSVNVLGKRDKLTVGTGMLGVRVGVAEIVEGTDSVVDDIVDS